MPREAQTEYGTIKVNPAFRNTVDYEMGNPNPRDGIVPVPQREILDDIVDGLGGAVRIIGEMPDVVIKSRGAVEKIPKAVEDLPAFQGAENVFLPPKRLWEFHTQSKKVARYTFHRESISFHEERPLTLSHPKATA